MKIFMGLEYFHIPGIFMAHEFCNPLKTHEFEHHEKLGIGFMGFSTPLKTCEILMAFFMGISRSCVWWRKIHGP